MLAFLVLGGSLAANGVQESRVAKARQLIAEKNYNDAILILTQVVREEPDRQDEAQELINEVVKLRNQYNSDYERVIDLLYVKDDVEGAIKVIEGLEALDTNPNKQTIAEIKQAKRTARLKANNKRYNDIMARALAFLEKKQYGSAVQVYLEGQDLARDMFLEAEYGNVLNNQVDRAWADLRAAATLFVQTEAQLKTLPAQGINLLASSTSPTALEPVLAPMRELAGWRQRVWADGGLFRAQNQFLVKNDRQVDFFLDYSGRFVFGPPDGKVPEGILGAIDRLWAEALDPWTVKVRSEVETQYTAAKAALDQGRYTEAKTGFESLRIKARQGIEVITLWNRVAGIDTSGAVDPAYRAKLNQIVPLGVWLEHRAILATQGAQAAVDLPRAAALAATPTLDRAALELARADVRGQKATFATFGTFGTGWVAQSQALVTSGFSVLDPASFGTAWRTTWNDYRQKALALEAGFVDRRGILDYGLLDGRFQEAQKSLTAARDLVEGTIKYPLQATSKLADIRPVQDALATDISSFVALYDTEPAEVKTTAVAAWPVKGRDLLGKLTTAQTLQGQLLTVAQANYAQSVTLKKQGLDLVTSVVTATNAENFTRARADLNTISTRFSDSLRFQEDVAFRTESDLQVKDLFDQILKKENEVVVREVRALINQGIDAYQAANFRGSEQLLTRAQKRWADTNKDANSEVEYWLGLTNLALSVTTGREISPLDPLFNEVQQLLNFSRRDYTLGKERLDAGKREEGLALMAQATATLGKILLTAPRNQEAGLLKLEILKASDPEGFPVVYKQNFDAAVAKMSDNDPTVIQTGYTDLQDLNRVQPDYPGMDAALKAFRLKLQIDKPAVDVKQLAEAKNLVAQATRLFEGGSPTQLADAQARIRRALNLDPKNTAAQDLSDKISLKITNFVATLTPTQIGELNDMLDLLRTQQNLQALARITEFKAKYPAVANDARVKEVERRIKAVN